MEDLFAWKLLMEASMLFALLLAWSIAMRLARPSVSENVGPGPGVLLGDVPAATAILDRFLAHAEIVQMTGKSYRLRQRASPAMDA